MSNEYKPYGSRYTPPRVPVRTSCPILRELFRIAQEEKRYTLRQIAAGLNQSDTSVNFYRAGRRMPDMPTYLEFAKFLGVDIRVTGRA